MSVVESTAPAGPGSPFQGRVRLRRFAAPMIPATPAGAVLIAMTAEGAIGAQFSISGIPFVISANQLRETGFEHFGDLDQVAPGSPNLAGTGGQAAVMVCAIQSAQLTNLCQSVSLGGIFLVLRAGGASSPVQATDLVVDSSQLSGNAGFTKIEIGQDASTLNTVPGVTGPLGDFGRQSPGVTINNLRQTNHATTASTFTLPGLNTSFQSKGC